MENGNKENLPNNDRVHAQDFINRFIIKEFSQGEANTRRVDTVKLNRFVSIKESINEDIMLNDSQQDLLESALDSLLNTSEPRDIGREAMDNLTIVIFANLCK